MANFRLATATQNGIADKLASLMDAGTIAFYDGEQPASAVTAIGDQRLLATLWFDSPAFSSASVGTIMANAIWQQNATATGTATWARVADASGNAIFDCDVGEKDNTDATIVLNTTRIVESGPVVITSFTISVPSG